MYAFHKLPFGTKFSFLRQRRRLLPCLVPAPRTENRPQYANLSSTQRASSTTSHRYEAFLQFTEAARCQIQIPTMLTYLAHLLPYSDRAPDN